MDNNEDGVTHDESQDPLGLDNLIESTRTLLTAIPDLSAGGKHAHSRHQTTCQNHVFTAEEVIDISSAFNLSLVVSPPILSLAEQRVELPVARCNSVMSLHLQNHCRNHGKKNSGERGLCHCAPPSNVLYEHASGHLKSGCGLWLPSRCSSTSARLLQGATKDVGVATLLPTFALCPHECSQREGSFLPPHAHPLPVWATVREPTSISA